MHPVYHAKITVSTRNFPRSEEILVSVEFTTLDDEVKI
jgi:hypothetical protein